MEEEIVKLLQKLGFSKNEALVYITLLKYGPLNARTLSDLSGVPYSKVYSILESLSDRGFITIIEARPRTYMAVDPQEAIPVYVNSLVENIKNTEKKLLELVKKAFARKAKVEERRVILIRDPSLIASKVAEAIRNARKYVKLSGPNRLISRLKEELEEAVKRGVKIYILSPEDPKIEGASRKRLNSMGGGIIIDGREVIILLKEGDSFIALYSDHPSLTIVAETYYDSLRTQDTS